MHPEISVVIPAYNAERFIASALDSALSQSMSPREIIVVDDGSTDGTRDVVGRYEEKVRYVFQSNAGPSTARNTGVREAKGEWIAFLDSDDFWDADHLKLLMGSISPGTETALVYGGKKFVNIDGHEMADGYTQYRFPSGWIFPDLLRANYISSTSVVIVKRSVFLQTGGFNTGMRNSEDYELWLRISAVAPMCGVPVYSVNYRRHDSNLTLQRMNHIKGHLKAVHNAWGLMRDKKVDRRNFSEEFNFPEIMRHYYSEIAIELFYLGEYKEMRSMGLTALRNRFVTAPLALRWAISYLPEKFILKIRKAGRGFKGAG